MKLKRIFFLLIFLVSLQIALASTVTTNKGTYTPSESVTITVTGCSGSSILTISSPSGQVFSDQGNGNWQTTYHTSSDPSTGTYTINAFCGAEEFSTTFSVAEPSGNGATTSNGGGTGGRGGTCISDWSCGTWSYCGRTLTQTRTCTDLKYCMLPKAETQPCLVCDESWVCSIWSACIAGRQTRICSDEHICGTILKKPILQKVCNAPDTGPPPARIEPPQKLPPPVEIPPEPSFWDEYKLWLILIPSILILLAAAGFLYFRYFRKPKEGAVNITPLKNWARTALAKGASKEKIKEMVHKQTKWTDKELDQAFKELGSK